MPLARPTLAELITRVRADFRSRLGLEGALPRPLVRRSMADVLATVWGGVAHLFYGHIEWAVRQLFAIWAERDFLVALASMWGLSPTPATYSSGTVTATGVDTTGIPQDTVFVRDDGAKFRATAAATIGSSVSGQATVSVEALEAGAAGETELGATLVFETPIADVNSDTTVDDDGSGNGLSGGTDEEETEDFRSRFLLELRKPSAGEGGNDADYERWARSVAGVTRVWVYPNENGLGTVVVRFVRDKDVDIIPSAGEVAAVQTAIDAKKPNTAEATAAAPVASQVDFTIALTPDTAATRAAVQAQLEDLFNQYAAPGDGAGLGKILLSKMRTSIGIADGVEDYTLTAPVADVVPALGDLPTVGDFTWA